MKEKKKYEQTKLPEPLVKKCAFCHSEFQIIYKSAADKRFCNTSCSAKWRMSQPEILAKIHTKEVAEKRGRSKSLWWKTDAANVERQRIAALNPMTNPESRRKCSETLKRIGHKPKLRGGNGKGVTVPQSILMERLTGNWAVEFAISLGPKKDGYPTCYKVDLVDLERKIAIEVDGSSHYSRKDQDAKKDEMLNSLGWTVVRVWNKEIEDWANNNFSESHQVAERLKANKIEFLKAN